MKRTAILGVGAIFLTMIGIPYFLGYAKSVHRYSGNDGQYLLETTSRLDPLEKKINFMDRLEEKIHLNSIQMKEVNLINAEHKQKTDWEAVKYLFNKCESSGLSLFIIQPSLLREVQEGKVDLWFQRPHPVLTFGIMESSVDTLRMVIKSMGNKYSETLDEDPRGFKPGAKSTKEIVTHVLLREQVEGQPNVVIHLVVFFDRKEYFWHAAGHDKFVPQIELSDPLFVKAAGSYNKFQLDTVQVDGTTIRYPHDPLVFLKEIENSTFIECNHTRASRFHVDHPITNPEKVNPYREKTRRLLSLAKSVLDKMGITFWLSGGTCLGWYRQCDIIPYTTDVDIGVFVKDYNPGIVSAFQQAGFKHIYTFGKLSDSYQLSFSYRGLKLDMFFFYVEDSIMWMGHTQTTDRAKFKYTFPSFTTIWTEFLGLWVRAPFPPETYVKTDYGPEWMNPSKRWDWTKSPKNIVPNGFWPNDSSLIQFH